MRFLGQSIRTGVSILILCGIAAASGFEITGIGAKARGMGGAFRAIADDWSAAYYNPAGYALLLDNSLGLNVGFLQNRNELDPQYFEDGGLGQPYQWGHFNDRTIFNVHEIVNNPSAGIVVRTPIWGETVFGFSIYQPFDNSITWNLFGGLDSYNRDVSLIPDEQYKSDLDVVAFQFTAGREFVPDKLSIGIGLQLLRVDMLHKDIFLRSSPLSAPLSDRSWDRIPEFSTVDGIGYGFGFRGGILWKPSEKLSVGVTGAVSSEITVDGDAFLKFLMPDRATQSGFNLFQPGTPEFLFTNGGIVALDAKFESKLKLPPSFGLGLAYQLTEKLLVSFDAEYTLWSKYKGLNFSLSDFSTLPVGGTDDSVANFFQSSLARPVIHEDAGKIMGGFLYDVSDFMSFVGGVSFDQGASQNFNDLTPQFIDTGDKLGLNGGILVKIDRWDLGIITSYIDYSELSVSGLQDIDGDGVEDNFPGNFRAETFETVFTINYRF